MIHQTMRSVLSFGLVVAVCLQATRTRVYGMDFKQFNELMDALPACQSSTEALQMEHKFHGDHSCDRKLANDPVTHASRVLRLKEFPPSLSINLPREQTLYCPPVTATNEALLLDEGDSVVEGHQERWILMNEGTKPISVSFWAQKERKLVSAYNRYISPAQHDPGAIVNPGKWRTITAWQGHVFVMHQLELVEGVLMQDRILATHRVGLVPIGLNFEAPSNANVPVPMMATNNNKDFINERIPTSNPPSPMGEFCNVMHKGFINEANYPVDLYFAERRSTFANTNNNHTLSQTSDGDENDSHNLPSCRQVLTNIHLGVHHDPSQDAHHTLNDWESPLRYVGTYVTHTFVARLHHDPSIIVQEYTVSPVIVRDCSIQEDNKDSTVNQAATVATTVPIIQDELSMMISTSTYPSIHLASSLSNSTLLYNTS